MVDYLVFCRKDDMTGSPEPYLRCDNPIDVVAYIQRRLKDAGSSLTPEDFTVLRGEILKVKARFVVQGISLESEGE